MKKYVLLFFAVTSVRPYETASDSTHENDIAYLVKLHRLAQENLYNTELPAEDRYFAQVIYHGLRFCVADNTAYDLMSCPGNPIRYDSLGLGDPYVLASGCGIMSPKLMRIIVSSLRLHADDDCPSADYDAIKKALIHAAKTKGESCAILQDFLLSCKCTLDKPEKDKASARAFQKILQEK